MENTNSKKKMSSAKQKKKRVRKAFRIAGEILVGIQILATLVLIGNDSCQVCSGVCGITFCFCGVAFYYAGGDQRKSDCQ